jgi:hypothetical protein
MVKGRSLKNGRNIQSVSPGDFVSAIGLLVVIVVCSEEERLTYFGAD